MDSDAIYRTADKKNVKLLFEFEERDCIIAFINDHYDMKGYLLL